MDGKTLEFLKKEFNIKDDPETLHKFSVDYGIMSPVIEKETSFCCSLLAQRR
jgi:hypothetical protein